MIQKLLVNTVKRETQILLILLTRELGVNVMKNSLKSQIETSFTDSKLVIWLRDKMKLFGEKYLFLITNIEKML